MSVTETIAVTGATGQLGRLVIAHLQKIAPQAHLTGIVRNPAIAHDLAARGVELREANYDDGAALAAALSGVDKLLLISSSEVGGESPSTAMSSMPRKLPGSNSSRIRASCERIRA